MGCGRDDNRMRGHVAPVRGGTMPDAPLARRVHAAAAMVEVTNGKVRDHRTCASALPPPRVAETGFATSTASPMPRPGVAWPPDPVRRTCRSSSWPDSCGTRAAYRGTPPARRRAAMRQSRGNRPRFRSFSTTGRIRKTQTAPPLRRPGDLGGAVGGCFRRGARPEVLCP